MLLFLKKTKKSVGDTDQVDKTNKKSYQKVTIDPTPESKSTHSTNSNKSNVIKRSQAVKHHSEIYCSSNDVTDISHDPVDSPSGESSLSTAVVFNDCYEVDIYGITKDAKALSQNENNQNFNKNVEMSKLAVA